MATPRRRSSRLRGSVTPTRNNTMSSIPCLNKLSSLLERDESPPEGVQQSIDSLVSSPVAPPNTAIPQHHINGMLSAIKTPQTDSRLQPAMGEMHPSKVHQSTAKPSEGSTTAPPAKVFGQSPDKATPTKSGGSLPNHMSSPGFDFSFTRPESDLSAEAQKIMDSVREEAARIKAQMQAERDKQDQNGGETNQLYGVGGRKIAKPKGKSGRYSDAHKQEFKKMDSIANHASTWKAKLQPKATSLKRSNSKAGLNEPQPAKQLPKSISTNSLRAVGDSGRLENTAPGKRMKKSKDDDTSNARPMSREGNGAPATPARAFPASTNLPSAINTPTKASLARSASVKSMKTSMIPSLSRSASTKTLEASPPKSEGSNKYFSSFNKFSNMKSILSRRQPKFSSDPAKVAAGTHLPMPDTSMNLDKDLPTLPGAFPSSEQCPPTIKRVEFTPSTKARRDPSVTPSPSKIPTKNQLSTPSDPQIEYPSITSPNITHRSPSKTRDQPSTPGDFTFTSARTINFGPPTSGLPAGSTIRPVRPSGFPTPIAASFGSSENMPAIAHGMPNKKRKHADSDEETEDGEDRENKPPSTDPKAGDEDGRQAKRVKTSPEKRVFKTGGSKIPKMGGSKGKGLSLSRLNVLARPKDRR